MKNKIIIFFISSIFIILFGYNFVNKHHLNLIQKNKNNNQEETEEENNQEETEKEKNNQEIEEYIPFIDSYAQYIIFAIYCGVFSLIAFKFEDKKLSFEDLKDHVIEYISCFFVVAILIGELFVSSLIYSISCLIQKKSLKYAFTRRFYFRSWIHGILFIIFLFVFPLINLFIFGFDFSKKALYFCYDNFSVMFIEIDNFAEFEKKREKFFKEIVDDTKNRDPLPDLINTKSFYQKFEKDKEYFRKVVDICFSILNVIDHDLINIICKKRKENKSFFTPGFTDLIETIKGKERYKLERFLMYNDDYFPKIKYNSNNFEELSEPIDELINMLEFVDPSNETRYYDVSYKYNSNGNCYSVFQDFKSLYKICLVIKREILDLCSKNIISKKYQDAIDPIVLEINEYIKELKSIKIIREMKF